MYLLVPCINRSEVPYFSVCKIKEYFKNKKKYNQNVTYNFSTHTKAVKKCETKKIFTGGTLQRNGPSNLLGLRCPKWHERRVLEAWEINVYGEKAINRDDGLRLWYDEYL